eukprot:11132073-Prorocentrum_lima.AAC.1
MASCTSHILSCPGRTHALRRICSSSSWTLSNTHCYHLHIPPFRGGEDQSVISKPSGRKES